MQGQPEYSGGCQCGAIRFHVRGALTDSSICHCRMCQKAFGAYYAPLVTVSEAEFRWTRGEPRRFASSNLVRRGFCADCGTPLTYEMPDGVSVAAGAFDEPGRVPPSIQYGVEGKRSSSTPCTPCRRDVPTRTPVSRISWPGWSRASIRTMTPSSGRPRTECGRRR